MTLSMPRKELDAVQASKARTATIRGKARVQALGASVGTTASATIALPLWPKTKGMKSRKTSGRLAMIKK
ncbi:hypothetical protein D3C87_2099980 [compost metagenome]